MRYVTGLTVIMTGAIAFGTGAFWKAVTLSQAQIAARELASIPHCPPYSASEPQPANRAPAAVPAPAPLPAIPADLSKLKVSEIYDLADNWIKVKGEVPPFLDAAVKAHPTAEMITHIDKLQGRYDLKIISVLEDNKALFSRGLVIGGQAQINRALSRHGNERYRAGTFTQTAPAQIVPPTALKVSTRPGCALNNFYKWASKP